MSLFTFVVVLGAFGAGLILGVVCMLIPFWMYVKQAEAAASAPSPKPTPRKSGTSLPSTPLN
jgi:hypothetical protein